MNKLILKQIYIGAGVVILFIWMFVNIDCLSVYVPLMLTGIALTAIAVSLILYYIKNDILEIPGKNISDNNEITASKAFSRPVELNDIAFALEGMGYKVNGIENRFINFNDGEENYKLCSDWIYRYQMNCIGIYKTYTVDQEDVEEMSRITAEITHNIRVVKLRMLSNDDRTRHGLEVSADSFYPDSASLSATILALLDFIDEAMSRLRKEMPQ